MARRAATDFAADWVINSDADEFWWPRGGSLKDVFAGVPPRFGSVRGMWRHFPPRPHGDEFFAERMTVRVLNPGAEDNSPYSPRFKAAHRSDPEVKVLSGNHQAIGRDLRALTGWYPIDVLHFPFRSLEQFSEKLLRWLCPRSLEVPELGSRGRAVREDARVLRVVSRRRRRARARLG